MPSLVETPRLDVRLWNVGMWRVWRTTLRVCAKARDGAKHDVQTNTLHIMLALLELQHTRGQPVGQRVTPYVLQHFVPILAPFWPQPLALGTE